MTMIAPSTEPAEPAVIPPCPAWCRLAPGHSYPSLTPDFRSVSRHHDGHPDSVGASITQEETYRDGVIAFGPLAITVLPAELEMQDLTAAEARTRAADEIRRAAALVAELLAAADQLDALNAAAAYATDAELTAAEARQVAALLLDTLTTGSATR